jgi:hypothetical protein
MRHISIAIVAASLLALTIAEPGLGAQRGPVDTGPGTLAAARKYLEGRWRLLSFDVTPPGKQPIRVLGAGNLTYDGFGNLTVEIRVDGATAAMLEANGIQTEKGVLSTSGRTAVDLQSRTLTYTFEGQAPLGAPSGPLALNRPRHWQVDGNVLTVTTKNDEGQTVSVGKWEKAP